MVAGANVEAMNSATGVSYKTVSSSGGEFQFQDLPLGAYVVTVQCTGFKTEKIENVPVSAGTIYTLPVKLSITSTAQTIEVSANELALDTTSTTQTTVLGSAPLQDTPLNGRDFTQLIILSPGFSNSGAAGTAR